MTITIDDHQFELVPLWEVSSPVKYDGKSYLTTEEQTDYDWQVEPVVGYMLRPVKEQGDDTN